MYVSMYISPLINVNANVMYTRYVRGAGKIMETLMKKISCWEGHGYLGYSKI